MKLHSLACHSAVEMAVHGFASLARCSDQPLHFVVHDDGSLTPEDCGRLRTALGEVTIVDRRTADAAVDERLARHPLCREYRQSHPLALKLLDIPMLAGDDVAICDTDLFAFAPFAGLFEFPAADVGGVFMPDTQNAYSMRPWHLMASGIALPSRVNTGLMLFRQARYDLDFIEWFLARQFNVYRRLPGWLEQTCWAALAHRGRCFLYDAAQVRVIRNGSCFDDGDLLIGHFTADVRGLWARTEPRSSTRITRVRTTPATTLSPARLAAEQIGRAARRGRGWLSQVALQR